MVLVTLATISPREANVTVPIDTKIKTETTLPSPAI